MLTKNVTASQKIDVEFDHFQMEFEVHILCARSYPEYYSHTKYELRTPSLRGPTNICVFKICIGGGGRLVSRHLVVDAIVVALLSEGG